MRRGQRRVHILSSKAKSRGESRRRIGFPEKAMRGAHIERRWVTGQIRTRLCPRHPADFDIISIRR